MLYLDKRSANEGVHATLLENKHVVRSIAYANGAGYLYDELSNNGSNDVVCLTLGRNSLEEMLSLCHLLSYIDGVPTEIFSARLNDFPSEILDLRRKDMFCQQGDMEKEHITTEHGFVIPCGIGATSKYLDRFDNEEAFLLEARKYLFSTLFPIVFCKKEHLDISEKKKLEITKKHLVRAAASQEQQRQAYLDMFGVVPIVYFNKLEADGKL